MRCLLLVIALSCTVAYGQNRRDASLAEQKMCSEQADKLEADDQARFPHEVFSVSSHYSTARNICWVNLRMMHLEKNGDVISESQSLLDGFEKVVYGTCAVNDSRDNSTVVTCWATSPDDSAKRNLPNAVAWRGFVDANYFSK
jgi:hypothetical protein